MKMLEFLLLWMPGIAWGVKLGLVISSILLFVGAIEARKENDKRWMKIMIRLSILLAFIAVVFPPEATWLGWLEIARRP